MVFLGNHLISLNVGFQFNVMIGFTQADFGSSICSSCQMLTLRYSPAIFDPVTLASSTSCLLRRRISFSPSPSPICAAKGPRPRYPRVWKTKKKIGTISKSLKLVDCIKELSNVKEEVYGALDSFIAWELEFPIITVKKALKTLENEKEWKRIIQVTKWMLSKGQGRTMGSYYMLLNALAEDGRIDEAEELWMKLFSENLESMPRIFFERMVSIYYRIEMHEKMFEVFADMEELGINPTVLIVSKVGDVLQKRGMLDKYKKLKKKYPPPKWEYCYIKGKRVRIRSKHLDTSGDSKDRDASGGEETNKDSPGLYEGSDMGADELGAGLNKHEFADVCPSKPYSETLNPSTLA